MKIKVYFNDHCLDDEIEGFITLGIDGRNFSGLELSTKNNVFDGSKLQKRRIPSRQIDVSYYISAKSETEFEEKHDKLLNILYNAGESKLWFDDQPGKYYKAVYKSETEDARAVYNAQATISFICMKPYAYSTQEKTFESYLDADEIRTIDIVNNGNVPAEIDYQIKFNSPNAFIGIVSEEGAMQYGAKNYTDDAKPESTTVMTLDDFIKATDDGGGVDPMRPSYGNKGKLEVVDWWGRKYLKLYSSGEKVGTINGGSRTVELSEEIGEFVCSFNAVFCAKPNQVGQMNISFMTADNRLVCGLEWNKNKTVSTSDTTFNIVAPNGQGWGGKFFNSAENADNPWLHSKSNNGYLAKKGSRITYYDSGKYSTLVIPESANLKIKKVKIAIRQNGDDDYSNDGLVEYMGFCGFSLSKYDIFSTGEEVTIDGSKTMFYEGGMPMQSKEKMGTKYFKAKVGTTKVQFYWSSWIEQAPTVTAKIRERWM